MQHLQENNPSSVKEQVKRKKKRKTRYWGGKDNTEKYKNYDEN